MPGSLIMLGIVTFFGVWSLLAANTEGQHQDGAALQDVCLVQTSLEAQRALSSVQPHSQAQKRLVFNPHADIVFGQSAAFSGQNAALGTQLREGIVAALREANAKNAGVTFGLISYDDGYEPGPAVINTEKLIDEDKVFALLGYVGTPTAISTVPIAIDQKVPFLGAFTGAKFLRQPFERYVVNYRASYIDETAAMIAYFVDELKLTRISIFYQADGFGAAGVEGVELALQSRGMAVYNYGTYPRNTVDILPGLQNMTSNSPDGPPEAVVMIGTAAPLAAFVKEAKLSWPDAYFSTVSFVGSESFAELLDTGANRQRVFVTQVVPFPLDLSLPIVTQYQEALNASGCAELGFTSFEGYLIGRFATVVAASVTKGAGVGSGAKCRQDLRERYLDEVYNSGIVLVGSYRLGPFGGCCAQVGTACRCNQGQRQVFGSKIKANGTFADFAPLDLQFQTCGLQYSSTVYECARNDL